jgi:Rad3-related DNA helicase
LALWHAPLTAEESELDLVDLVARRVFGHRGFRPRQRDIIDAAIAQQDIFVLMPTGGGKSLCYQVRALTGRERRECVRCSALLQVQKLRRLLSLHTARR